MVRSGTIRIGISGWTYKGWRGVFYPPGLPHRRELDYAARRFPAIEINGTFYRLQRPASFARWQAETPEGFVFAVKGPQYLTHMLRLRGIETALANFMASGLLRLGRKLGPILWQFPERMAFDGGLFEAFLAALPRDTAEAAALARRHDARLDGRDWLDAGIELPLRHAVEIRHDSFRSPAFVEMLRRHRVALVCADTVDWPLLMDLTADFVYCRLHGSEQLYASGYDGPALKRWAGRIRTWAEGGDPAADPHVLPPLAASQAGRDVYLFFDNDAKVRAPVDAAALASILLQPGEVSP